MNALIIAGTSSNCGKTTVTMALMGILNKNGETVAPFKVGPDYIDPKFHKAVTNKNSYNLDGYMLDKETLKYLFDKNCKNKSIAIIEGVMGLYDGLGTTEIGSTAEIAQILKIPVILVVEAKGISRSIAALINGYKNFNNKINIKGVILNKVSGESHYNLLKKIIEIETKVECIGYIENDNSISFSERHLGLIPAEEINDLKLKIDSLINKTDKTIDIDKILNISKNTYGQNKIKNMNFDIKDIGKKLKVGLARDKAFNFYYQDNIDLMIESGIEIIEFNTLNDDKIPEDIDALYIGGGYPEVIPALLSKNRKLIKDIKNKLDNGIPCYAECGGLMYLSSGIFDKDEKFFPMVDFFKCKTKLTKNLQRFGYIEIDFDGIKIKAHEFHYSIMEDIQKNDFAYKFKIKKAGNNKEWECGLAKKNVIAGYPHIHFYSNIDFFKKIIRLFKEKKIVN